MDGPSPLWRRPTSLLAFACGSALAAAAARTQHPRVDAIVQRALVDLADPVLAPDAFRRLEHLGPLAITPLGALFHHTRRASSPVAVRQQALYVLARLGRLALPVLPDMVDLLRHDDPEVSRAACWTLAQLAPFLSEPQCRAVRAELHLAPREVRTAPTAVLLWAALELGNQPSPSRVAAALSERYTAECIAACRWLVVHAAALGDQRAELQNAVHNRLERVLERAPVRWRGPRPGSQEAPELAEAWLALTAAPLTAGPARALLDHWDPGERRRAIAWLQDHGASLPLRERADLIGRLWDSDPQLVLLACDALRDWRSRALVAVPSLRLLQRTHADRQLALYCGLTADRIVADDGHLGPADRALLAAMDAALQQRPAPEFLGPATVAGLEAASELLLLAQWNDAPTLERLLALVDAAGPCRDDAITAVFGWLDHDDPAVVQSACAWLATHRRQARKAVGDHDSAPFDWLCRWTARHLARADCQRTMVEAQVHLLLPGDGPLASLHADDGRMLAHALAVGLAAPRGTLGPAVARLQQLVAMPQCPVVVATDLHDRRELAVDLARPVRVLAALALVDLEIEPQPTPGLAADVQQLLAVPLAGLPAYVAALRARDELPALLDRLEDECRRQLGVPMQLCWPSVRDAAR